jgi:dihydropyrimidinase
MALPFGPFDCIVLNGTVVTAADVGRYDIAIKDGKIALLAPSLSLRDVPAERVIDAEGAYVMVCSSLILHFQALTNVQPGGVDAHVHLAEPELFGKGRPADDYTSGTWRPW